MKHPIVFQFALLEEGMEDSEAEAEELTACDCFVLGTMSLREGGTTGQVCIQTMDGKTRERMNANDTLFIALGILEMVAKTDELGDPLRSAIMESVTKLQGMRLAEALENKTPPVVNKEESEDWGSLCNVRAPKYGLAN